MNLDEKIRARLDCIAEWGEGAGPIIEQNNALRSVLDLMPAWAGHCSACDAMLRVIAEDLGVSDA